jgi:hypothetical protein
VAALDWIFSTPTVRAADFEKQAGIPVPTAKRILRCLENAEILGVIRVSRVKSLGRPTSLSRNMFTGRTRLK